MGKVIQGIEEVIFYPLRIVLFFHADHCRRPKGFFGGAMFGKTVVFKKHASNYDIAVPYKNWFIAHSSSFLIKNAAGIARSCM